MCTICFWTQKGKTQTRMHHCRLRATTLQMVQKKAQSKATLETIAGVGDARIEKYGPRFLEFLNEQWGTGHETDGEPV